MNENLVLLFGVYFKEGFVFRSIEVEVWRFEFESLFLFDFLDDLGKLFLFKFYFFCVWNGV